MSATVNSHPVNGHHIKLDDVRPNMAKADLKKLEDQRNRQRFGQILARAVELSGLIGKEAAAELSADPGQFSRWLSGAENAAVYRFAAHDILGPALLAALAEQTEGAEIRQVITLSRKVG